MPHEGDEDSLKKVEEALLRYAHTMHEYTLRLWTDSRKRAEERLGKGVGGDPRKQPASAAQTKGQEHAKGANKESTGAREHART